MLSKVRIKEHPIHPMLIAFPVAMYVATAVSLIVFAVTKDAFWFRAGYWTNLAGVVMAAVAAVPGLIDLLHVPAKSRARQTGWVHASLNVAALIVFVISVVLLGRSLYDRSAPSFEYVPSLVLSLIGCGITMVAGWFGWKMVQTHHVGVKPSARGVGLGETEDVDDVDELIVPPAAPIPAEAGLPMHH
jgi:uncharacterized membrane protein